MEIKSNIFYRSFLRIFYVFVLCFFSTQIIATEYNIEWELNGGNWRDDETGITTYNSSPGGLVIFSKPFRENYNFIGWYDNPDFNGHRFEAINNPSTSNNTYIVDTNLANKTYYAKWELAVCADGATPIYINPKQLNTEIKSNVNNNGVLTEGKTNFRYRCFSRSSFASTYANANETSRNRCEAWSTTCPINVKQCYSNTNPWWGTDESVSEVVCDDTYKINYHIDDLAYVDYLAGITNNNSITTQKCKYSRMFSDVPLGMSIFYIPNTNSDKKHQIKVQTACISVSGINNSNIMPISDAELQNKINTFFTSYNTGSNCFCKLSQIDDYIVSAPWVYSGTNNYDGTCSNDCTRWCMNDILKNIKSTTRFNEYDYACPDNTITKTAVYMTNNECQQTIHDNYFEKPGYQFIGWQFEDANNIVERLNEHDDSELVYDLINYDLKNTINKNLIDATTTVGELKTSITTSAIDSSTRVSELIDLIAPITPEREMNLVAQWELIPYTITYHYIENATNVETLPTLYYVTDNDIILANPQHAHMTFIAWCTNEELTDCVEQNTVAIPKGTIDNRDFYAKWEPDLYNIYFFDDDETTPINIVSYYYGDDKNIIFLPNDYDDYIFTGWCPENDKNCDNPLTDIQIQSDDFGDKKFYAKYVLNNFTITYIDNGETIDLGFDNYSPSTTPLPLPAPPARMNYTFDGWYEIPNTETTMEITPYSHGDKTFYAKWDFDCNSGHWWHIGDDKLCITPQKPSTHPIVVFQIGGTKYYAFMSENTKKINKDADTKLKIRMHNKTYTVHDESME